MAFCTSCGSETAAGAGFCPRCGAALPAGAVAQTAHTTDTGMAENVAGLLCYLVGWVTGLVFFLIDKRPFVRFHAAQSMVVFGGLAILYFLFGIFFRASFMFMGGFGALGFVALLSSLIWLVGVVLWVLLMVKAYQHEKFEVPIAAGIAKSIAGN
ncbi:MAG TPA: DUF4870 domain-containing protein [Bryobacteraceae bacterium]|nr:DUF4870 domain-containing protein [Bryobacteraceae bacterium]